MLRAIITSALFFLAVSTKALIVRHDIADEKFIALAKRYPQICHFPMGEGTLIASQWIVTAGHIGFDLRRDLQAGMKPQVICNGKTYDIDGVALHPGFKSIDEGLANDIALVKLKTAVTDVKPVRVYSSHDEKAKRIVLVGRGDRGTGLTGPEKWDMVTRAATNTIDGVDALWIQFDFDGPESKDVTDFEGVSGPGDSGGPALLDNGGTLFLVGVSSFQRGQEKFGKGRYGVTEYYARASSYVPWIEATCKNPSTTAIERLTPIVSATPAQTGTKLAEYVGQYGFRKIVLKDNKLYFQRENEPLIPMKEIEKDTFLWDDNNTKLKFLRDSKNKIVGFEIQRRNGEVVKVDKDPA